MPKTVIHTCLYCKKEFEVLIKEHNRGKGKYCSVSCGISHRNKAGYPNRKAPNMKGPNNPAWKGGISKKAYRYKKIQVERFPEKIRARRLLANAVKAGKIQRRPCFCGEIQGFAHHADYSKPLEVTWLCRKHHHEEHIKEFKKAG